MNNLAWFSAAQWFCQQHDLPAHIEGLCQGLPVDRADQFTEPLFFRALEKQGFSIERLQFEASFLKLAPLLIEFDQALWIIQPQTSEQLQLQPLNAELEKTTVMPSAIENLPVWSVQRQQVLDVRSEEHYQAESKHWLRMAIDEVKPWYRDLLIGSVVVNLLALITPLFTMNVYDRVVPNAATHTLWVLASGVFVVIIFDWLLRQARSQIGDTAGKHIDKKISAELFAKVLGMQLEHRPQSSASFSKQIQEFDSVREFFTSATIVSAVDLPFTLIFLALISYLGGWMVFIPMGLMVFLLLSSWLIKSKLAEAVDESSKLSTQRQAHLLENLNLLQQIKHHNAESRSQRQWESIINNMAEWQVRSKFLSNSMSHILMSVQQLTSVLLVIAGVYQIFAGALSMGGLIAIVMISGRAASSVNQLTMLILRYHQCKSAITSLETTMALPQEHNQKAQLSGEFAGQLTLQALTFSYPDTEQPVLNRISLMVKAKEKVALIGTAGSGKSTFLALLARQYQVAYGQLQFDGVDAALWPVARLRASIGYMPQMPLLHFGSIMDNLVMGLSEVTKEQLTNAINASGVSTFIQQLPKGLETPVGELGRNLSGGQRQAILLARTLMNSPRLLVLDEPTSFMDQYMKQHVIKHLQKLNVTMVIASHDPALLAICSAHYPLQQGQLLDKIEKSPARRTKVTLKDQQGNVLEKKSTKAKTVAQNHD